MSALIYLYRKNLKNRAKKAIRKPITYFYLFLILIYVVFLPIGLNEILSEMTWNTPDKLAAIFTVVAFWLIPMSLVSYAKRKGLIYRKGDVHFLFTAPVSPKKILLYAHIKTLFVYTIVGIIVMLAGYFMFGASLLQIGAYFIASMILENLLEGSLMVLFYGSEKINAKGRKVAEIAMYILIGMFILLGVMVYFQKGLSIESVFYYLGMDAVQMVPIVGWYIGLIHLIFAGPTLVNCIVSVLYILLTLILTVAAVKMKCTGEFYEDAMQFADDYEELREKKSNGEVARLGRKEKFKKASVTYKGGGAKALFYKQLLEYKKSTLFFFDSTTLIMLGLGAFIGLMWSQSMQEIKDFVLPMAMGYTVFCMSAVAGKWGKEIKSPYTFLIPDSPMRKLWYATVLEHIKAAVSGAALAIPLGIYIKVAPLQIIFSIIFYVCLQACKIYNTIITEVVVGNVLGKVGKQLFIMLLQGIVLGVAATAAGIGTFVFSIEVGYLLMIGVLLVIGFALMTAANITFDKMEIVE